MASSAKQDVVNHRRKKCDGGEPLDTVERSVGYEGAGQSLTHNIPRTARRILDISTEDDVVIRIFEDGYWVEKK